MSTHRLLRPRRLTVAAAVVYATTWLVNRSLQRVEGPSMLPSLWPGDLLLTVPTRLLRPRTGDVVVADLLGRRVTKRVVAVGDRVERRSEPTAELRDGHLLVDGDWWDVPDAVRVDEDVALHVTSDDVVLLGDHRARSTDTRATGPVPAGSVRRIALVRLRPLTWLRGRSRRLEGSRVRPGVRVVVLDPDDRVLLFRVSDTDGGPATWWEAPGGGRHAGEPPAVAAARELAEEVGTHVGAPVALGESHTHQTRLRGAWLTKVEDLFAVRVTDTAVDPTGWTAAEHRDIVTHRWWTRDELAALGPGEVVPADLVRLADVAADRV